MTTLKQLEVRFGVTFLPGIALEEIVRILRQLGATEGEIEGALEEIVGGG